MRRDLLIGVLVTVAFFAVGVVAVVALVTRHRGDIPVDGTADPIDAALVSADGRHVIASATLTATTSECRTPKLTARETDRTVDLTFTTQPYDGPCQLGGGSMGTTVGRVVLAHPLAGRALVDHSSGKSVRYFDGRALWRVSYLPPGWRFQSEDPYPFENRSRSALTWTRRYFGAQAQMNVVQSDGPLVSHDHSRPVATVRVAGQPVQLHYSSGSYTARWSRGAMYFGLDVASTGRGDPAMTIAGVERVLTGLRR